MRLAFPLVLSLLAAAETSPDSRSRRKSGAQ